MARHARSGAGILAEHPEVASSDIHTAAVLGDHQAVGRFLAGDTANATAKGGPRNWDALTHLCFSKFLRLEPARTEGFLKAATALLDAGASVEGAGLTLTAAVCLGRTDDIARLAKAAGAQEKQKALAAGAYNGRLDAIDTAIALGADPNAPNVGLNPKATALHNAVCSGSLAAVQQLLVAGASVGAKDGSYDATPLVWAEYFVRESGAAKVEYFQPEGSRPKQYAKIAEYFRNKEDAS